MMKRVLLMVVALMMCCVCASGEEDVYGKVSDALYRIVLRTEEGDQTLGSGVLFLEKSVVLTAQSCCREGSLYAIGADGEHAIREWKPAEDSGAALLALDTPSSAEPLTLANYEAQGLPYIFGTDAQGNLGAGLLYQMLYSMYRGRTALLISAEEGILPGAIAADEQGCIIGLVVAQQMEGVGMYTALEPDTLYTAISGEKGDFLETSISWKNGALTVSWKDEKRTGGSYLITVSGEENQYYTSYEAAYGERSIQLDVPPGHTYYVQTQWVASAGQEKELSWSDMTVFTVPEAALSMSGYQMQCYLGQTEAGQEPADVLEEVSFVSVDLLADEGSDWYLQAVSTYTTTEKVDLPMIVELIAPDGQFFYEELICTLTPEMGDEDYFAVPLDSMIDDCAMFSEKGALQPGEYRLRCSVAGKIAAEYAFTVQSAGAQPSQPAQEPASTPAPAATSGILTGVKAVCEQGLVKLDWSHCAVPEDAKVTVYFMYSGNLYYSYYAMKPGETTVEFGAVPGRTCMAWVAWNTTDAAMDFYPRLEEEFVTIESAQGGAYAENGFLHVRGGLTLTDSKNPEGDGVYLPESAITREKLTDPALTLVFQTEDRYQVEAESLDHALVFALHTPEGCVFVEQGYYNFYPEYNESDMWVKDLSGIVDNYAAFMGESAWPAGEYVFGYYIDGQTVCEIAFTLE